MFVKSIKCFYSMCVVHFRNFITCTKIKLKYFCKSIIRRIHSKKKIRCFPYTIQLPITYKCNFNCIMCGMRNLIKNNDFTPDELDKILKNKLFKKVNSVGLNGGEPFLRKDLVECVRVIIGNLPKLKSFFIISNGYFTDEIKEKLSDIYDVCKKHNIKVNVSFSVDGVDNMQDFMRGHQNAWDNVFNTVNSIKTDIDKYCDTLGIICTVTKHNVFNLEEVEAWGKNNSLNIRYNIATLNERIANSDRYEDFSIFCDEKARLMAMEFFYKKAIEEKSETYFGIYLYIRDRKRYAQCPCQFNEWVTLSPNGNISYCATYSKELGCALEQSAFDLFNGNIDVLKEIRKRNCTSCSHYISQLDVSGMKLFRQELLKNQKIVF